MYFGLQSSPHVLLLLYLFFKWLVCETYFLYIQQGFKYTANKNWVCCISFPFLFFETAEVCSLLCITLLLFMRGFDKKLLKRTFCYLHWYLPNLSCSEWHCSSSRWWEVSGFPGWHNLRQHSVPLLLQWCLLFDLQAGSAELHLQKTCL